MKTPAARTAFGGILAAFAVIIMSLGGLIPVATYVCPVLCIILVRVILDICGKRIAWAWYAAVAILSMLLSPDKEAAFVFLFLGYYPIIKSQIERVKISILLKLGIFNLSIGALYFMLIHLLGMSDLENEFRELGFILGGILLILGNVTFFLLDRILGKDLIKRYIKNG